MKNKILLLFAMTAFFCKAQNQIGINTKSSTPNATLDIRKNDNSTKIAPGIIDVRLTGDELQERVSLYKKSEHDGAFVFVTSIPKNKNSQTKLINGQGYYFYDSHDDLWKPMQPKSEKEIILAVVDKNNYQTLNPNINGKPNNKIIWNTLRGLNSKQIRIEDNYYILFPPGRSFKVTGMIGIPFVIDKPTYITSYFVLTDEQGNIVTSDFVTTNGYTESSTETYSDGGVTNPIAIFSTGKKTLKLHLMAGIPADNRPTYIAGKSTDTSLGTYLLIEEI